MLGLKSIEAVSGFIILMLVYIFSVTPAGCFRAWVAKKMGDSTAEELGFLSLNPLVHFDPFGIVILFLFSDVARVKIATMLAGRTVPIYIGFGWGRQVPIDISNIHGRYRWAKVALVLFSDTFVHFCLPVIALIVSKGIFLFRATGDSLTPVTLLVFQMYQAFMYFNVWLLMVEGVINAVMLTVLYYGRDASLHDMYKLSYAALLIPIIIVFLFGSMISGVIIHAINVVGSLIL